MNDIQQRQTEIQNEFANLIDWEARYKKIIEIGKALPPIHENFQIEENKVKGCQSQVWMFAEIDENKNMIIHADSDALIVRGLVALLVKVYSGSKPSEIINSPPEFINKLGLSEHLSPSRANGLNAMVKQIMFYALAFSTQL